MEIKTIIYNQNKIILIFLFLFLLSCSVTQVKNKTEQTLLDEVEITKIPLKGDVANRKSEISGLCWYKDNLILLPQFPNRFSKSKFGKIYYIKKYRILNFLTGKDTTSISPKSYHFPLTALLRFNFGSLLNNNL